MTINHIQISKSRTVGGSSNDMRKMRFNKIVITMDADLSPTDDSEAAYSELSAKIDEALDYEQTKSAPVDIKPKI